MSFLFVVFCTKWLHFFPNNKKSEKIQGTKYSLLAYRWQFVVITWQWDPTGHHCRVFLCQIFKVSMKTFRWSHKYITYCFFFFFHLDCLLRLCYAMWKPNSHYRTWFLGIGLRARAGNGYIRLPHDEHCQHSYISAWTDLSFKYETECDCIILCDRVAWNTPKLKGWQVTFYMRGTYRTIFQ